MCLIVGRAYRIPTVALRFFNVYGPRQALSNPYTGVMAIFASQLLNNLPPLIFEDGLQQRDFIHVRDLAEGCRLALETPDVAGEVFNLGSGHRHTVREVGERVAAALGRENVEPKIIERYRVGDIRHCFADTSLARRRLGFEPRITFEEGVADLVNWLERQEVDGRAPDARTELEERGLTV